PETLVAVRLTRKRPKPCTCGAGRATGRRSSPWPLWRGAANANTCPVRAAVRASGAASTLDLSRCAALEQSRPALLIHRCYRLVLLRCARVPAHAARLRPPRCRKRNFCHTPGRRPQVAYVFDPRKLVDPHRTAG